MNYSIYLFGGLEDFFALLSYRLKERLKMVQQYHFTVDTSNPRGSASRGAPFPWFIRGINFMQIKYRTNLRISRVLPGYSGNICFHRTHLFLNLPGTVRQVDRIPITLAHLSAICSWNLWRRSKNGGRFFK